MKRMLEQKKTIWRIFGEDPAKIMQVLKVSI